MVWYVLIDKLNSEDLGYLVYDAMSLT